MDEEVEGVWRVSRKGYSTIWSWIRMSAQMHEIECMPANIEITADECPIEHQVSFLLAMLLPTLETADEVGLFEGDPDA